MTKKNWLNIYFLNTDDTRLKPDFSQLKPENVTDFKPRKQIRIMLSLSFLRSV